MALCLVQTSWLVFSQERITDFDNGSQKAYEIGHEWNESKYLISFQPSGEVEIHQFKSLEDTRILFERSIPTAYLMATSVRFFENWVLFQSSTHQYTYDLDKRQLHEFEIPDGPFEIGKEPMLQAPGFCILRFTDVSNSNNYYFILDYDRGIEIFPPEYGTPVCRNGNEFVCHSFDFADGNTTSKFNLVDLKSGTQKLMIKNLLNQPTVTFCEQQYWFVDYNTPVSFDPISSQLKRYEHVKLIYTSTTSVHRKGDVLIAIGGVTNFYQVICYDLKSEKILNNQTGSAYGGNFLTEKVIFFKNYFICFDAGRQLFHFEYNNGLKRIYKVNFNPYPLSNRIPRVKENVDYFLNGKGFTKVDFQTGDTTFIPIDVDTFSSTSSDFINLHFEDNKVLSLHFTHYLRTTNHFLIDTKQFRASASNPTMSAIGMDEYSRLMRCGSRLYLWSKGLYYIHRDSIERLPSQTSGINTSNILGMDRYIGCRIRDTLMESYTIENNQLVVWHHNGNQTIRFGQIPYSQKIKEVYGLGNRIYVYELSNKNLLTIYDRNGNKLKYVESGNLSRIYQGSPSNFEHFYYLSQLNGHLFIIRDSSLISFDESGNEKIIATSEDFKSYFFTFTYNHRHYGYSQSDKFRFYELKEENVSLLYTSEKSLKSIHSSELHQKIIFNLNSSSNPLLVWDGNSFQELSIATGLYQSAMENNFVFFRSTPDRMGYLLDLRDLTIHKVLPSFEKEYFVNISITPRDTLLYSYIDLRENSEIKVYQIKERFTQILLKNSYKNFWPISSFQAEGYGNTRLLYTNQLTGILNEDGDLNLLSGLKASKTSGINFTPKANDYFVANDYLYFTAQDRKYGLQLYRMLVESPNSVVDELKVSHATIYPNPAHNQIFWEFQENSSNPAYYSIYQLSGTSVLQGYTYGSIDISTLPEGCYSLLLVINQKTFHHLIVKI